MYLQAEEAHRVQTSVKRLTVSENIITAQIQHKYTAPDFFSFNSLKLNPT